MPESPVQTPASPPRAWHSLAVHDAAAQLQVDLGTGLSSREARTRLERCGRNELAAKPGRSPLRMLVDQFRDVVVWVLLAAIVVSALMGDLTDAVVILAIVVLNAALGVAQESKAERSLAALREMSAPHARVVRDGRPQEIPAPEVVPGDLVLLEEGDYVPADLRLAESIQLRLNEAPLTGESLPVEKDARAVRAPEAAPGDRENMAFTGTTVVQGHGRGIAVATGAESQIGRIGTLLGGIPEEKTPLQVRLEELGRVLALVVLGVCLVVFLTGWLRGFAALPLLLTAVSLAVAAIPEGLPAVVTIVLALGMRRMVRQRVIVRRLRAVEALGSTTVICTDKTGTLTRSEMTVRRYWAGGAAGEVTGSGFEVQGEFRGDRGGSVDARSEPSLRTLLEIAVLCNNATLEQRDGDWTVTGDPTEVALLVASAKAGLTRRELEERLPRRHELPFDSDRKRMSVVLALPQVGCRIAVKGAPDVVVERCVALREGERVRPLTPEDRERLEEVTAGLAAQALRVLGFAYRDTEAVPLEAGAEAVERDLIFAGLLGMLDPPRPEARPAIERCQTAGVRPVMITGDYPLTARAVAQELGMAVDEAGVVTGLELGRLSDEALRERAERTTVYARVSPADKLRIVSALQQRGHVAAMTGDGVNDAPALKKADIGVAMGVTGTDVARGAADIVLTDDNFASIVAAVEEGRGIFDNIRKFVFYLLSCNVSEVLTIFLAIVVGLPPPLLPLQILWINLVTDGLPALALGVEPKDPELMRRPPRDPQEGILNAQTARDVLWYGGFLTATALTAYLYGLYRFCLAPAGYVGWNDALTVPGADFWNRPEVAEGVARARTLTFGTLAFGQLAHALNARSRERSLFQLGLRTNPQLLGAIALSAAAQLAVIYMPFAASVFRTVAPSGEALAVGAVLPVTPLLLGEIRKLILRRATTGSRRRRNG